MLHLQLIKASIFMYRKLNTDKFTDYTVSQRAYCVSEDNESVVYSSMSLPVQGNQLLNF